MIFHIPNAKLSVLCMFFSVSHLLSELYFDIIKCLENLVIYDAIKYFKSFIVPWMNNVFLQLFAMRECHTKEQI